MPKGSGLTKPMKLSADLADIVGKKEASRAECIKELWAYLKKNNLQDPANKQFFTPRQKDGKGFRYRSHPCLRHGQVSLRSLVIRSDRQEYSTSGTDKTKILRQGGPERTKKK